jgi:hypothetical protein
MQNQRGIMEATAGAPHRALTFSAPLWQVLTLRYAGETGTGGTPNRAYLRGGNKLGHVARAATWLSGVRW